MVERCGLDSHGSGQEPAAASISSALVNPDEVLEVYKRLGVSRQIE